MLIRISLIVAILAGITVGVVDFIKIKDNIQHLREDLAAEKSARQTAEHELASTKATLTRTQTELKQTQQTLATTKDERDKAVADAAALTKKTEELTTALGQAKKDRDVAAGNLQAYTQSGFSAAQVASLAKDMEALRQTIAGLQGENKVKDHKIDTLQAQLDVFTNPEKVVQLPNVQGRVLAADPKWDFVVLSVGDDQGIIPRGEFLVDRDGKMVAKVIVTSVQKDRCIANILPGWKLADVMEGDRVIPAYPKS